MHNVLGSVFPQTLIMELRDRAIANMDSIRDDYFPGGDFGTFRREHLGHTSLVMKMAAFRFASGDVLRALKSHLELKLVDPGRQDDVLLLHPIFYLRFSWPEISYSELHAKAFLDSQPHYDRAFGLNAFSFWTPLEAASDATGGICYFEDAAVTEEFPFGKSNKHNYDTYLAAAPQLDPLLRRTAKAPAMAVGDVFTFDHTVLHGATKPKTARRVSFDFRLCWASELAKVAPWVQSLVMEFNRAPDLCNARNLLLIGDNVGASRILKSLADEGKALALVADTLAQLPPAPDLLRQHAAMEWQREYAWARPQVSAAY